MNKSDQLSQSPLQVALIGLGKQGSKTHLPAIQKNSKLKLIAVVDADPAKLENIAQKYSVKGYTSTQSMLDATDGAIDMAVVATSHDTHMDIMGRLAENDIHVLKEKPACTTMREFRELESLLSCSKSKVAVVVQRRFDERFVVLKSKIDELGKIAKFEMDYKFNLDHLNDGWRSSKSLAGGGATIDMGYHMIDLAAFYFGVPKSVQATMSSGGRLNEEYSVEDTSNISMDYKENSEDREGAIGTINVSRTGYKKQEKIKVYGENGSLVMTNDYLKEYSKKGELTNKTTFTTDKKASYESQLDAFAQYVNGDVEDLPNQLDRHQEHTAIIDAIYQSSKQGCAVDVASIMDPPAVADYTWPIVSPEMRNAAVEQMNTSLSIYDRSGIIESFENTFAKYHNADYCLATNSGTSALWSMFYGIGLTKGDEVLVPSYTFFATASPLMHLGVKPVFCDSNVDDGNISVDDIASKITDKTKALVVTHMWGTPCDMEAISALCTEKGIKLLEDCSHAHGAMYKGKPVGSFGDAAAWSIQGAKIISGGEGGMMVTHDKDIYERAVLLGHYNKRSKQDVSHDNPLRPFYVTGAGQKLRAHPVAIKIAAQQFEHLDEWALQKNLYAQQIVEKLETIPFLSMPKIAAEGTRPAWYALVMQFNPEKAPCSLKHFVKKLNEAGLTEVSHPSSTGPIHDMPLFNRPNEILPHMYDQPIEKDERATFDNAERFYNNAIKLPVWAEKSDQAMVDKYINGILKVSESLFIDNVKKTMSVSLSKQIDFEVQKAKNEGVQKCVAGGLIINDSNEVLVFKRRPDDFMPNVYELPSGGVEKGEDIVTGLIRELQEETGIWFNTIDSMTDSFDYLSASGKKTRQFNFNFILPTDGQTVKLSEEHVDFFWAPNVKEIPEPGVTPKVADVMQSYFSGVK